MKEDTFGNGASSIFEGAFEKMVGGFGSAIVVLLCYYLWKWIRKPRVDVELTAEMEEGKSNVDIELTPEIEGSTKEYKTKEGN